MKVSTILKITIICFLLFGFSLSGDNLLWGAKQYVEVSLKDGNTVKFEYQSFMAGNFEFPEKLNRVASEGEVKTFGENRFRFVHRTSCGVLGVNLDSLVELEILRQEQNTCTGKKDWLIKILLTDNEEFEGYLDASAYNADRVLSHHNIQGILSDTGAEREIAFEDIKKIAFFPM